MVPNKIISFIFLLLPILSMGQTKGEVKEISKTAFTNGNAIQILNGQISVVDNQAEGKIRIYKAGSIAGIRRDINLIEGANTTITAVDNSGLDRVDITIATTGGGAIAWGGITGTLSSQTDLQNALNTKEASITAGTTSQYWRGDKTFQTLDKTAVGLANVDNTSDAGKPVSTATQTALNLKANLASPTFTGTVGGITATMVGLGNVDNTSDANKPVSTATQTALNGKANTATTLAGYGITDALNDDPDIKAYAALGSPFLAQTVGAPIQLSNTSTALVDGQIKFTAVYLAKAATITGIRVYVRVLGAYTGDNNNRVGLYSYSGGVLTLVASSANNATLWTSAANAFQTIAFSSTYAASAGIYFVGILYNNSAQTTAPALASGTALNNAAMATLAFANSAKLYGTANGTDLTTPINMTAITASTIPSWVTLY